MFAVLTVPDEIVIGFFSAVVVAMATTIGILFQQLTKCRRERKDVPPK